MNTTPFRCDRQSVSCSANSRTVPSGNRWDGGDGAGFYLGLYAQGGGRGIPWPGKEISGTNSDGSAGPTRFGKNWEVLGFYPT